MNGKTFDATPGPRDRFQSTKDIIARHYPSGDFPPRLMTDIFVALGEAERRGFAECLEIFRQREPADNDNHTKDTAID